MRFYLSAMRFLRSRPPGPLWVNVIAVVAGMQVISAVNMVLVRDKDFWPAFALTFVFASGYYVLAIGLLERIFSDDRDSGVAPPAR